MPVLPVPLHSSIYSDDRFPDNWGETIATNMVKIEDGFAAVIAARPDIMADATLTESARLVMLDKLYAARVAAHIPATQSALADAQTTPAFWQRQIDQLFAPGQTPPALALATEIRTALRAMTPKDRTIALTQARERGDKAIVSAVIAAPEMLTGVGNDQRTALREGFARQHYPEIYERVLAADKFASIATASQAALRNLRAEAFTPAEEMVLQKAKASSARTARHLN